MLLLVIPVRMVVVPLLAVVNLKEIPRKRKIELEYCLTINVRISNDSKLGFGEHDERLIENTILGQKF